VYPKHASTCPAFLYKPSSSERAQLRGACSRSGGGEQGTDESPCKLHDLLLFEVVVSWIECNNGERFDCMTGTAEQVIFKTSSMTISDIFKTL
jgi:hypothetical protein